MAAIDAVVDAAVIRFRPILLTTVTTFVIDADYAGALNGRPVP